MTIELTCTYDLPNNYTLGNILNRNTRAQVPRHTKEHKHKLPTQTDESHKT